MLRKEVISAYFDAKPTNTIFEQNSRLLNVKVGCRYFKRLVHFCIIT